MDGQNTPMHLTQHCPSGPARVLLIRYCPLSIVLIGFQAKYIEAGWPHAIKSFMKVTILVDVPKITLELKIA